MARLRDGRQQPRIPTAAVWLCAFTMFVLRLPSFNALEQERRRPRRWDRWVGARQPSADTVGRVLAGLSLKELRQRVVAVNRRA